LAISIDVGALEDDEATEKIQDFLNQVGDFFHATQNRSN